MGSNYKLAKPTNQIMPLVKDKSVSYKEIWDAIENIDSSLYLPVVWDDWGLASKFAQACKSKKIGKKGHPNPYADLTFLQRGNIVYIRGRR